MDDAQGGRGMSRPGGKAYRFFRNQGCEYFPCHPVSAEGFNCLFCYCPLYHVDCPGEPSYAGISGSRVKDCSGCDFPHRRENYEEVIRRLVLDTAGGGDGAS